MIAELISVGTELLLGNTLNTNVNYLAKKCAELGVTSYLQVTVGDNEDRLLDVIRTALSRSDIVILSGGLGPTTDDITKEVAAKVIGRELIQDKDVKQTIADYFQRTNRNNIPDNNWKQSYIIEGSIVLENHNGTAPGLIVEVDELELDKTIVKDKSLKKNSLTNRKFIILLPGPPREIIPMFEDSVMPFLREKLPGIFYTEVVKVCGYGESQAVTILKDLIENQTNPTIAPYAKVGQVDFRITASAKDEAEGKKLVKPIVDEFINIFGNDIFTTNEDESLEESLVNLLLKHHIKLATAESCTGGLLSGQIINVDGASSVFDEGFITYSNAAKVEYLGVRQETLDKFGAVSKETAGEMVAGLVKRTGKNAGLAVTGIAGPDGGTKEKPVGLVYIGCFLNGKIKVKEFMLNGNRQMVRERTVINALNMLRLEIIDQLGK